MKKLLLAAAAPLIITSHGFGLPKSTITIGDTKVEAARDGANGRLLLAQFRRRGINGQCGSANGVAVTIPPTSNLCSQGQAKRVAVTFSRAPRR